MATDGDWMASYVLDVDILSVVYSNEMESSIMWDTCLVGYTPGRRPPAPQGAGRGERPESSHRQALFQSVGTRLAEIPGFRRGLTP